MVANGHKDASVLVVESDGSEEEPVVRPRVRQESPRSPEKAANGKSGVLPACTELQACMAAWSVPQKQRSLLLWCRETQTRALSCEVKGCHVFLRSFPLGMTFQGKSVLREAHIDP